MRARNGAVLFRVHAVVIIIIGVVVAFFGIAGLYVLSAFLIYYFVVS